MWQKAKWFPLTCLQNDWFKASYVSDSDRSHTCTYYTPTHTHLPYNNFCNNPSVGFSFSFQSWMLLLCGQWLDLLSCYWIYQIFWSVLSTSPLAPETIRKFYDYLTHKVENMLSLYTVRSPSLEISNSHQLWLSSPFTAHKRYLSLPSPESHKFYISSQNHGKSVLQLIKLSLINRKSPKLPNSNSLWNFWCLTQNISNNITTSSFPPFI